MDLLLQEFEKEFQPKFSAGGYNRWPAFHFIARHLLSLEGAVQIVETGVMRQEGNFGGDGNSTVLWEWILSRVGGIGFSVDLNLEACQLARRLCPHMTITRSDSIQFLRKLPETRFVQSLDLLYLDSFDWSPEKHVSSTLHHMGELACVWDVLPSGCLIAVDDCHSETQGKHVLVKNFFRDMLGMEPLVSCHIQVWRKP